MNQAQSPDPRATKSWTKRKPQTEALVVAALTISNSRRQEKSAESPV